MRLYLPSDGTLATYCAQCATGTEDETALILKGQGAQDAYSPKSALLEKFGGTWLERDRYMTPGYVFFYADWDMSLTFESGDKPFCVLTYGEGRYRLAGRDLAYAAWIRRYGGRLPVSYADRDENGKMRFVKGPLADAVGRIVRLNKRKGRAVVEWDFENGARHFSLSFVWLSPAPETGR